MSCNRISIKDYLNNINTVYFNYLTKYLYILLYTIIFHRNIYYAHLFLYEKTYSHNP